MSIYHVLGARDRKVIDSVFAFKELNPINEIHMKK